MTARLWRMNLFDNLPLPPDPPHYERDARWMEIAGAMSMFWKGGAGPSQASVSSAFSLAGYDDGGTGAGSKQSRVNQALRVADDDLRARILGELVTLLRADEEFHRSTNAPLVTRLREALERQGIELTDSGFLDWRSESAPVRTPAVAAPVVSPMKVPVADGIPIVVEDHVPTFELLVSVLRRVPVAARPLRHRRRGQSPMMFDNEWAVQDLVEVALRTMFADVRNEEPGPAIAGASSKIDFVVRELTLAIEIKVTKAGRGEKHVKHELLVDFEDYKQHPKVQQVLAVVYDLAGTFVNPEGFEHDLTRVQDGLAITTIVVGWPAH